MATLPSVSEWDSESAYWVAPTQAVVKLHVLAYAGQHTTTTLAEAQEKFREVAELLQSIWPAGKTQEVEFLTYGRTRIRIPKELK